MKPTPEDEFQATVAYADNRRLEGLWLEHVRPRLRGWEWAIVTALVLQALDLALHAYEAFGR